MGFYVTISNSIPNFSTFGVFFFGIDALRTFFLGARLEFPIMSSASEGLHGLADAY